MFHTGYVLTCVYGNSQKRVPFFRVRLRSEIRVSFWAELRNKGTFLVTLNLRVRPVGSSSKGCDSLIMNFRDIGPFENLPHTHVNIGFYLSDPPGTVHRNKEMMPLSQKLEYYRPWCFLKLK